MRPPFLDSAKRRRCVGWEVAVPTNKARLACVARRLGTKRRVKRLVNHIDRSMSIKQGGWVMSSSLCKNLEGAIFPLPVEAVTSTKFSYVATNSEPSGHCTGINTTLNGRIAKPEGFTIAGDFCPPKLGRKPRGLDPPGWARGWWQDRTLERKTLGQSTAAQDAIDSK